MNNNENDNPEDPIASESTRGVQLHQDDLVLYGEDGKYYLVAKADYMSNPLPEELKSGPEFLVALGTVAADIPAVPTAGCACYLLNLAAIRNRSEKKPDEVESDPILSHPMTREQE